MGCDACTTPSNAIIYSGPNLLCIGVDKRESTTVALQKAEQTLCELQTEVNTLQQQVNALVATTTTIYPTTTTTTTAPGLILITNNSNDISVINGWFAWSGFPPSFNPNLYYISPYGNNGFPVLPGEAKYFSVTAPIGANNSALLIEAGANSGGGSFTGTCYNLSTTVSINTMGGDWAVNSNCPVPMSPGVVYQVTVNQS